MSESELHSQYRTAEICNSSLEEAFGPAIEPLKMPSHTYLLARQIVALVQRTLRDKGDAREFEQSVYDACEGALRDQDRIIVYLQKALADAIALLPTAEIRPITEVPCTKGPSDV